MDSVGASTARNIGIEEAKSEWLTFIDSDCIMLPGWAEALAPHLADRPKAIGGGVAFRLHIYWQLVYNISMFHEFLAQLAPSQRRYLPTLNLTVHRDVIRDTGLLDERLTRGQDVDWTIRMALAGYELHFEPRAAILHYPQRIDLYTVIRYWYLTGYFSIRNRLQHADYLGTPAFMGSSLALRALSPALAAYATVSMFAGLPNTVRYWHTVPAVYLTKLAWCLGAASGVKENREGNGET